MAVVLAIDAGTTGIRSIAVDEHGRPRHAAYREFPQHFPEPGRVEHDADDIWDATRTTLAEVVDSVQRDGETVTAIGITNQRETVVVWDRATGRPRHRAIVWQDRRTAARCDELRAAGHEPLIRRVTGLVLDPYFSATKLEWLLHGGGVESDRGLAFGTVDSWILWQLTGGPQGGVHATDPSNASRTMLFDIDALQWSSELLDVFGVPASCLPAVMPTSGVFGFTDPARAAGLRVPVAGIAGDQQAALFGQACFEPGMTKNTYGTGSFVLVNLGPTHPAPAEGLLTSVGWTLGAETTYVMEGSVFVTGAAIQWLRDGLGIIADAAETGPLASSVPDAGGVVFVPAFAGLGSPWWDPYARGTIVGITRGTTKAHLARAVVEAMAWQTRDVVDAITEASGRPIAELRADGGASVMDVLCQFQADVLGVPVRRPRVQQTTALGAAFLAGLATGVWGTPADAAAGWTAEAEFTPSAPAEDVARGYAEWRRAVERARGWAVDRG
ncbi:MAG TPA: glycerol kinase GlpK [Acidimicrobiia bacterium]|nr:glycerol kinase GlpK [Acidimicrobiia bacterium]